MPSLLSLIESSQLLLLSLLEDDGLAGFGLGMVLALFTFALAFKGEALYGGF